MSHPIISHCDILVRYSDEDAPPNGVIKAHQEILKTKMEWNATPLLLSTRKAPNDPNGIFVAHHNPEHMKRLYETLERAIEVIENLRSGTYSILEDNEPDIECRGDEDCGHCHYISVDKDAFEFLASIEKRGEE